MRAGVIFAVLMALAAWFATAGIDGARAAGVGCASAQASLERGQATQARDEYLELISGDESPPCAVAGLRATASTLSAETRLCAEGEALAKSGDNEAAQKRYVAALAKNVESECATTGLKPAAGKSLKDRIVEWSELIPKLLIAVFSLLGVLLLAYVAAKRWRHPSLVIKPFGNGGAEPEVGTAVAGLVEEELISLSEQGQGFEDGFELDFVVANVELLARDEDLTTAMGGLAETSQLQFVIALMSLIDRLFGKRSLVAEGELMPPGDNGHGLMLALHGHNELRAREAAWSPLDSAAPAGPVAAGEAGEEKPDPQPYYSLAPTAASWVQYQAARSLDSVVGLMTESPASFTLLARGIEAQRGEHLLLAEAFYSMALEVDPDNVAALFNLAMLQARLRGAFDDAIDLLADAIHVLDERSREKR